MANDAIKKSAHKIRARLAEGGEARSLVPDVDYTSDDPQMEVMARAQRPMTQAVGQQLKEDYENRLTYPQVKSAMRGDPEMARKVAENSLNWATGTLDAPARAATKAVAPTAKKFLELEHYSHVPGLKTIDPQFAGKGFDARIKGRSSEHPQSFFYEAGTPPELESGVGQSPHKYKTQVEVDKIYDIGKDPLKLVDKAIAENQGALNMDMVHAKVKEQGFKAYRNSANERLGNTVVSYEPLEVVSPSAAATRANNRVQALADQYIKSKGIQPGTSRAADVNPERGKMIASEYERMPHNPEHPEVKKAYDALIKETLDQFNIIKRSGIKIEKMKPGMENPYPKGSQEMLNDIKENNHLWYYPTEAGFGSGKTANHPLLAETGEVLNGEKLKANDVFRIVHDVFGHAKEGSSFGPKGEEAAWLAHMPMYSKDAQKALTTETRGQNSWVNFGPKGAENRANPGSTTYAEQKAGILPSWAMEHSPKIKAPAPKAPQDKLGFYSKIEQHVMDKMGASADPAQIKGMLKDVKPEEYKHLGIDGFLEGKKKVTKQELLNHIAENKLQLEEIVKKGTIPSNHISTYGDEGEFYALVQDDADNILSNPGPFDTEEEAVEAAISGLEGDTFERRFGISDSGTKYDQYTLPGGDNYQERLYQLPKKKFEPKLPDNIKGLEKRYEELNDTITHTSPLDPAREVALKERNSIQKTLREYYDPIGKKQEELSAPPDYQSGHYDEPNIISSARTKDRIDADGNKHLFIEEIQSDWHQEGRKKGYKPSQAENQRISDEVEKLKAEKRDLMDYGRSRDKLSTDEVLAKTKPLDQKIGALVSRVNHGVPDAPLKKNWHEMTMKRLVKDAVDNGYSHISWTTGAQQAERYSLNKSVSDLIYHPEQNALVAIDLNGEEITHKVYKKDLPDFVGKEVAERLLDTPLSKNGFHTLSGVDLEIGGEGMKGFYDKILPDFMNKLGKKYGTKVESSRMPGAASLPENTYIGVHGHGQNEYFFVSHNGEKLGNKKFKTEEEARNFMIKTFPVDAGVHSMKITPALKKAAQEEGFSIFQMGAVGLGAGAAAASGQEPREGFAEGGEVGEIGYNPIQSDIIDYSQLGKQGLPPSGPAGNINVLSPDNQFGSLPESQLQAALAAGYRIPSPQEEAHHLRQQEFGTPGQQAITAAEGAAEAMTFGTSTGMERALGMSTPERITARREVNPGMHMLGQVGGLAASALIPVAGEANIMRAGGMGLAKAVGLTGASTVQQIGAQAVRGAFEMALMQGGSEISKAFAEDPNQTAETAIADIGLSTVMGGVFGGAIGAALNTAKRINTRVISEVDRPAMEAGTFESAIKASGLFKPHESEGIMASLGKVKKNASEIQEAGERLGAQVMEGMVSDSKLVQKAEDALINGVPTYSGIKRQQLYKDGFTKASQAVDSALGEGSTRSKAELGNIIKDGLTFSLEEQNAPIQAMYDTLKQSHQVLPLMDGAGQILKKEIQGIQELRLSPSSPEGQMARRVMQEVEGLKTVDDIKSYKSILSRSVSPTASSGEKRMAAVLGDKLKQLEEDSIEAFAISTNDPALLNLIPARKAANAQYSQFISKIQTLSEQLGKGRVYGVQDALNFIQDLTPEQVVSKLFSKNNSQFLSFFEKEFPEQMQLMRDYQKGVFRAEASRTGELSPKLLFNKLNKLEPEIKATLFSEAELQKLQDAETYIRAIPKNFNPSGTAHMDAMRGFFEHPLGATMANVRDLGLEKFIKLVSASPEVNQAITLAKAAVKGEKAAQRGIKEIFKAAASQADDAVMVSSRSGGEKERKKLDTLVSKYKQDPDALAKIGDNNPLPEFSQTFAATSARAVQYLGALKPDTAGKAPLDPRMPTSSTEEAKYNRALDTASDPMSVLRRIKDSTITPDDVLTLNAIYPGLYAKLSKGIQQEIIESRHADKTIPYVTRMGLSTFLGEPLDSTMTQIGILGAQPPKQQGGASGGAAPAPAPRKSGGVSKMPQNYQTPSQTREARRQKP